MGLDVSWQFARRRKHLLMANPHRYRYTLIEGVYEPTCELSLCERWLARHNPEAFVFFQQNIQDSRQIARHSRLGGWREAMTAASQLNSALHWSSTPQGHSYWLSIINKMKQCKP